MPNLKDNTMFARYKLLFVTVIIGLLVIADNPLVIAKSQPISHPLTSGYSALKLFLEDEQHLTTIRRTKMLLTFSSISEQSRQLIDTINDHSERAIEELEQLATKPSAFTFRDFSDESIGKATFDSMRLETAKDFLFENENFERDLLLSQLKILPVISHLARQLEEKESNVKRRTWLKKLALQYENHYQKIKSRLFSSAKT